MSPLFVVVIALGALVAFIIWIVWHNISPNRTEEWPVTEGTIQSVGTVVIHAGRNTRSVDVSDFSYNVNGEYYSGRLTIAPSLSTGDRSTRGLVHQKIEVHYHPQKPEKFSVPQTEVEGFLLSPFNDAFGEDVDPIDLNIDKI